MNDELMPVKDELAYNLDGYLGSGIEAWASGPEVPQIWVQWMLDEYGAGYEGFPQILEMITEAGDIIPFPLQKVVLHKCYRCLQNIQVPNGLQHDQQFCQLCWYKMGALATLRGMRDMLIDLGADGEKIDEMWKLYGM